MDMPEKEEATQNPEQNEKRTFWQWIRLKKKTATIGLSVLTAALLASGIWVYWILQPPHGSAVKTVKIQAGSSTSEIADQLYQNGLIRSPFGFKLYMKLTGLSGNLRAGEYHIRQGTSLQDLVQVLKMGDRTFGTVRVTIPEGFTLEQIADLLQKSGVMSASAFLQEADHGTFDSPLVRQIPKNPALKHPLEGYLFPDTYDLYKHSDPHAVIQKMLGRTEQVLTQSMLDEIRKRNLTIHQVLTIASMIEREAKVEKERPIIAGVIYNRLSQQPPMPLQIDATVQYVVGNKAELTEQDLKTDSPYNTYLHTGLPPGPIASPGMSSLQAAINPDKNPYLYYVVKNNGSGEHYFAKTYEEQLQNEKISEQNASQQTH
jgi:UPF0755 protein